MDKLGKVFYKMDFKNCSKANTLKPQNGYFYIGINPYDMGLHVRKPIFSGLRDNKAADQPAHPHRLIGAFVIRLLERIISRLAMSEISFFYLVSVAEKTGLKFALSETAKTGFLATRPIC